MDPGDLVELKAGQFGLEPPENLAIYLDRTKRKKAYLAIVHTVKGRKEVKLDQVRDPGYAHHVDPDQRESQLTHELKKLVQKARHGDLEEQVQVAESDLDDRGLWERVKGLGEGSPEDIAASYFGTQAPSGHQVALVREVLKSCERKGVGYFERAGRDRWQVLGPDAYHEVKEAAQAVAALKNRFVSVREVERDDGSVRRVYEGVPLDELTLTDDDRALLETVADVMESFVRHDEWRGDVGLAGTFVHTIDGFSLFEQCKWLAQDWTGNTGTISGAFAEFLLRADLRDVDDLVTLIAERKVLDHEHFTWEVAPEAEREAARLQDGIPPDEVARRVDLRDLPAWTIDPPDAKDFDDAVSFTRHDDGSATLWVHIADVAHHVPDDGFIDHHARQRATSVYLPVKVLPMLPHRLADDLCSLRDDAPRLAVSVRMDFDADAEMTSASFHESIVRVDENLSYDHVNDAVEAGDEPFAGMEAFARELKAKRMGLEIETDDRRVHLTDEGVELELKSASPSTRMIERFMVAANEAVAEHLQAHDVPQPYRCHPLPDREAVRRYNAQMEALGLEHRIELPAREEDDEEAEDGSTILDQLEQGGKMELTGGGGMITGLDEEDDEEDADDAAPWMDGLAQLDPHERAAWLDPFNDVLREVLEMDDPQLRELVYLKTLSCLGRALYTPRNLGHFGLGSASYAHFTSPIRRYPDLLVHRQLKWLLRRGETGTGPGAPDHARPDGPDPLAQDLPEDPPYDLDELEDVAAHATDQGADAEGLEWSVIDVAMAVLAHEGRWSGTQPGLVQGFSQGGVFLSLPGHLETRLPVSRIPGGPWSVDEDRTMLFKGELEDPTLAETLHAGNWQDLLDEDRQEAIQVKFTLGERVPVRIANIDLVEGQVAAREARPGDDDGGEGSEGGDEPGTADEDPPADDDEAEGDDAAEADGPGPEGPDT